MGVHGLWKLIDSSGKAIPLEALENKILAVDVSIWLYQLVKGFQENVGNSVANGYLLGLFYRICKLLFYRIKPIFVFDGGVPVLKRKTIAARQSNRAKANQMGEKLRLTLLQNLLKQEALGKALGENVIFPKLFQPKQDTLFSLPPIPVSDEFDSDSDSEKDSIKYRYKDLQSIDITSEEFLSLPPDMRHDILTELKECRKQNSWAKVHLMPEVGDEFSDFQMRRLLKRRAIQVGIEKAEGEMGTRGFTLSDIQTILSDQGVELAQRIASDNSTRLLYNKKIKEIPTADHPATSSEIDTELKKLNKLCKDSTFTSEDIDIHLELDETITSSENDSFNDKSLTQAEILEIIKQESIPPAHKFKESHNEVESSLTCQELPKNMEIKGTELSVNSEVVEKQTVNNVEDLEHGNLPQDSSSHNQLSSPQSLQQEHLLHSPSDPENFGIRNNTNKISNLFLDRNQQMIHPNGNCSITNENISVEACDKLEKKPKTELENLMQLEKSESVPNIFKNCERTLLEKQAETSNTDETTSEYSDDDFIEVNEEKNKDAEESNIISQESMLVEGKFVNNNSSRKHMEIIIDSREELKDDLFADIFGDMKNPHESAVENRFDEKELNDHPGTSTGTSEHLPKEHNFLNLEISGKSTSNSNSIKEVPRSVPQLSINEIMQMRKDLEQESSSLIRETSREEKIASTITEQIRLDAQELLQLFGIPYIIAPLEAEAQCAYMDLTGQTQGTITDDSDIWLFGGNSVFKNFFDQKKFVQQFKATDITRCLHITRDEMIMLALLSGSDYTLGLTGVGAVTAFEVIAHYPKTQRESTPHERLKRFAKEFKTKTIAASIAKKLKKASLLEGFPSNEVINAYLNPEVDQSSEPFSWSKPDVNQIQRYTRDKFGWEPRKTDKILGPVMESLSKTQTQGTLHRFFEWKFDDIESTRSKRIEGAINLIKTPSLLTEEPGPSTSRPPIRGNPKYALQNKDLPMKSKTPAQIAREKAAKKFKELKKLGKIGPKSKKK